MIRLSAPGDVAMTIPVLHSLRAAYPDLRITVLTQERLAPLFAGLDATLLAADTKGRHKGWKGLLLLVREVTAFLRQSGGRTVVADLHGVLRAAVLCSLLRLQGYPVAVIQKGRNGKRLLTRRAGKQLKPLPTSFDRYRDVLARLGFSFPYRFNGLFTEPPALPEAAAALAAGRRQPWIGLAPFAAFREKMYPLEQMEQVVARLQEKYTVFLFGSPAEAPLLASWQQRYPGCVSVAGTLHLEEELQLMAHLAVMVSMDSANMHFASLVRVPVVSVWGPTHPFAGFMGWQQEAALAVQTDLPCRPCSVFGNQPCYLGTHACMRELSPERIVERVSFVLGEQSFTTPSAATLT